ncbi:hypothetical protein Y032_0063g3454 [Ancylostoma ceylanicum]|uniref:DNA2/NAM7 helicase-like C-terminal domain-containing protein n=1 Tax=Ancylostoma ceylanicum TaxID=53326 RepID=A0A016U269_9BILA|nr:hypothetical protein Y032_0063g3454 [Ancylostoma ceylanicum]
MPNPSVPFLFIDVPGTTVRSASGSHSNAVEANTCRELVTALLTKNIPPTSIAIITFYKEQLGVMERFANQHQIDLHTVDSVQGREKDIVILLTTRTAIQSKYFGLWRPVANRYRSDGSVCLIFCTFSFAYPNCHFFRFQRISHLFLTSVKSYLSQVCLDRSVETTMTCGDIQVSHSTTGVLVLEGLFGMLITNITLIFKRILCNQFYHVARSKPGGSSYAQLCSSYCTAPRASETNTQWFSSRTSFDALFSKAPEHALEELNSFDEFGSLSSRNVKPTTSHIEAPERSFMDQLLSHDASSAINFSAIPTTADPSELGGCAESGDGEQLEELMEQGYDVTAVINDLAGAERQSTICGLEESNFRNGTAVATSVTQRRQLGSASSLPSSLTSDCSSVHERPSPTEADIQVRFDPDIHRPIKATVEEIMSAVHNQDISLLRSILMEKSWPDQRTVGHYLDDLFDLVIRDCHDIDEAMVFFQDYAASNRRSFLHDVNGIRLACRAAHDTGSVSAAMETLRLFRNMFLVRSPVAAKHVTPVLVLEQFYTSLSCIGTAAEMEQLHKMMIEWGFDDSSDVFIRTLTESVLKNRDFHCAFETWRSFSTRYGTTCASDLIWERLLVLVEDKKKQARFAGELLSHCLLYDHPFAVIADLLVTLVRMKRPDDARLVFTKVSVPGRFFRKPLQNLVQHEDSTHMLEDFASLVTDCMFAEKRRSKSSTRISQTPFMSSDLLLVLDSFYGSGRPKQPEPLNRSEKKKLHRVNDLQLFELSELVQSLWLQKAEKSCDVQALDRLIAWSAANKLQISPKLMKRITKMKSRTS